jgi:hypothetical protein
LKEGIEEELLELTGELDRTEAGVVGAETKGTDVLLFGLTTLFKESLKLNEDLATF